jgi:hypothetical protein
MQNYLMLHLMVQKVTARLWKEFCSFASSIVTLLFHMEPHNLSQYLKTGVLLSIVPKITDPSFRGH